MSNPDVISRCGLSPQPRQDVVIVHWDVHSSLRTSFKGHRTEPATTTTLSCTVAQATCKSSIPPAFGTCPLGQDVIKDNEGLADLYYSGVLSGLCYKILSVARLYFCNAVRLAQVSRFYKTADISMLSKARTL